MEYLAFYIITIIASFVMKLTNELRIFKDVADAGYKIDMKRVNELNNSLNLDHNSNLEMFIPILNIIRVMESTMQYNSVRPMILDQFNTLDCLQEMSKSEREGYLKKPTALNAILINVISEAKKESGIMKINFKDEHGQNQICFRFSESNDIVIVSANGVAANLTVEEQTEKVSQYLSSMLDAGVNKYGSIDAFLAAISKEKGTIELNSDNQTDNQEEQIETSYTEELSSSEKLEALQDWKNDLLSGQSSIESKTYDKTYVNKK